MRHVKYVIERKSTSLALKALWNDSAGNGETILVSLRGWRARMISSAFEDCDGSWDAAMKVLVAMRALSSCRTRGGAEKLIDTIRTMELGEVHLWASKMMFDKKRAPSALKRLYGVS